MQTQPQQLSNNKPQANASPAMHLLSNVAPFIVGLSVAFIVANAWLAIARLFGRLGADAFTQILAGASSVGMMMALAVLAGVPRSASVRALASIYLVAWLPLTIAAAAVEGRRALGWFELALMCVWSGVFLGISYLIPAISMSYAATESFVGALKPSNWLSVMSGGGGYLSRWFLGITVALLISVPAILLAIVSNMLSDSPDEQVVATALLVSACNLLCVTPLSSAYNVLFLGHWWGSLSGALPERAIFIR